MTRWTSGIRRALRDETGGVTVLALFSLLLTVVCVGFAIDATNFYRHQTMLRMAADAAAHAGASALARGATPEVAEAAAMEMVALNLPDAADGSLLADRDTDLRAVVVGAVDGKLSRPDPETPANAMLVSLQRSATARNAIPTLILGLFGFDSWSTGASSVAMVAPTRRCSNAAGLFAHGPITIGADGLGAQPNDGMCLHSQIALQLPDGVDEYWAEPALSLPSRTACSGGSCESAAEVNLIMPDVADYVARLARGFAEQDRSLDEKETFFLTRPISENLEPLSEVGADVRGLRTGRVVALSAFRFRLLREIPQGLVYLVLCGQPGTEIETGGEDQIVIGEWANAPVLRNIALVTTCPIRLAEHARVEGTVIISLADDTGLANADPSARIGDPDGTCDAARRSILMTKGNLVLPSHLTRSNIAVVAGGNVTLGLAGEASNPIARGIAVHAGGEIRSNGAQGFKPCAGAADPLLPVLRVVSHTMPPVDGWITPLKPREEPDLPGNRPDRLALQGARS
ncbi:MAG: pilus assembly protein TadG-related protein [Paracoccaceae bacterium]